MRKLVVFLLVLGALGVAVDVSVRKVAQDELARRVANRVPAATSTSAQIRSFPFLGRLLLSGEVPEVDAAATDVTVRGVRFASLGVALYGVTIDRREVLSNRRVVMSGIDRGQARATLDAAALSEYFGVPITLEPGKASVDVGGVKVAATVSIVDGQLKVSGVNVPSPALSLVAPLLPCVPNARIELGRVVLTCDFTEIPQELRVGAQL